MLKSTPELKSNICKMLEVFFKFNNNNNFMVIISPDIPLSIRYFQVCSRCKRVKLYVQNVLIC